MRVQQPLDELRPLDHVHQQVGHAAHGPGPLVEREAELVAAEPVGLGGKLCGDVGIPRVVAGVGPLVAVQVARAP